MMIDLSTAFPRSVENTCTSIETEPVFYVIDPSEKKSKVVYEEPNEHPHFCVKNISKNEITFLAIDKCVFLDSDHSKCDFALYDVGKFCLVEIGKGGKNSSRSNKKAKAYIQLTKTIEAFKQELDSYQIEKWAIVCVGFREPIPAFTAKSQPQRLKFSELGYTLFEGNEIAF